MFESTSDAVLFESTAAAITPSADYRAWRIQQDQQVWQQLCQRWTELGGDPEQDFALQQELRQRSWESWAADWPERCRQLRSLERRPELLSFLKGWQAGGEPGPLSRQTGLSRYVVKQLLEVATWLLHPRSGAAGGGLDSQAVTAEVSNRFRGLLEEARQSLEQQQPGASRLLRDEAELLAQLPHDSAQQERWLVQQTKLLGNADRLDMVRRNRLLGQTLQSIGTLAGLTRERVRQIISKYEHLVVSAEEAAARYRELEWQQLQTWATSLPESRLPDLAILEQEQPEIHALIQQYFQLSRPPRFVERLQIAEALGLDVEAEERALFQAIADGAGGGTGFFTEERLGRFLHWYADYRGEPGRMPKQTSLPDSVRGHVTRLGGQGVCAERYGLQSQGQVTGGKGGRTFWTPVRLMEMLHDCAEQQGNLSVMPSRSELIEFLSTDPRYVGQGSPTSAIAALSRCNEGRSLSWLAVAQKYGFTHTPQTSVVNRKFVQAFVRSLGEHIETLTPAEIYVLFERQGITTSGGGQRSYDLLIDAFQAGKVSASELRQWGEGQATPLVDEILAAGQALKQENASRQEYDLCLESLLAAGRHEVEQRVEDPSCELPELQPVKALEALDKAIEALGAVSDDDEAIAFLVAKAKGKLWTACFKDEASVTGLSLEGDTYSATVHREFLEEYEAARSLPLPDGYDFHDLADRPATPKLMQKLLAFRMLRDKRCLNLSGTGTGKTLSAILASRVCESQVTLIVCPNAVVETWARVIRDAFPAVDVVTKPDSWRVRHRGNRPLYIVVNHEMVQNRYRTGIGECLQNYSPDFLVIDEIHQTKQRDPNEFSQRRLILSTIVRFLQEGNPDLRVLGLSATPVVNNLFEGESLLSIIQGRDTDHAMKDDSAANCMKLYQGFVRHGIRMMPQGRDRKNTHLIPVNADAARDDLLAIASQRKLHPAEVEQILTPHRFEAMRRCIQGKTVVFIQFIEGILEPLQRYLDEQGISHCCHTGEFKESRQAGFSDALDEFIHGDTQVLIASIRTLATGVDGLQRVCRNVVFLQLPWTSTEYEQAVGRFDRDGCLFEDIDIHIPLTVVANGEEEWSWCRSKLDRIRSKKDIARASVDGEIGDSKGMLTPQKATRYWLNWLQQVEAATEDSGALSA